MYKKRAHAQGVRKTILAVTLISVILATAVLACGCSGDTYRVEYIYSMGTVLTISVYADDEQFEAFLSETREILTYAESLVAEGGPIADFNAAPYGENIKIDKTVYDILLWVKSDPLLSGYNPLVYPLADLWGFTPRFSSGDDSVVYPYDRQKNADGSIPLPDRKYIDAFLSLTDLDGLVLSQSDEGYFCAKQIAPVTVYGVEYGAKLDFGGCLKGYCLERMEQAFDDCGLTYGYLSFGTSSVCLKSNKNGQWTLSLTSPDDTDATYYSTRLQNKNASTSGDYEKYYCLDGKRYCHIIGKDGTPVNNARSVTVIGDSALYCDMLSTALMTVSTEDLDAKIAAVKSSGYEVVYCSGEPLNNIVSTLNK